MLTGVNFPFHSTRHSVKNPKLGVYSAYFSKQLFLLRKYTGTLTMIIRTAVRVIASSKGLVKSSKKLKYIFLKLAE